MGEHALPKGRAEKGMLRAERSGNLPLLPTPAMEAGLSNHVWSIEELVALLERISEGIRNEAEG
jgi:hypothetical protein